MGKESDVVRSHYSMGGTAWRYGLRVEGNGAPNNVLEWVKWRRLEQLNFDLGKEQINVLRGGDGPLWAQMWLGGLGGELYQIGRSKVYTPEELARMWGDRYRVIVSANGKAPQIEVHRLPQTGTWPRFMNVSPVPEDLGLLKAQMEGAGISFP